MMNQTCLIKTPLGEMMALVEQDALCGLWFLGQRYAPPECAEWRRDGDHPILSALAEQLAEYFAGQRRVFDLPLAPRGTPFQQSVWKLLQAISPGHVVTYGALSIELASLRNGTAPAPQAVGGAVGHNPICIVIPCHRVVGATGALTGYAGGLERKAALLQLEEVDLHSRAS